MKVNTPIEKLNNVVKKVLLLALSSGGLLAASAVVSAAELGDAAAPLQIAEWVKGKPVTLPKGKGKQIYVVEFWATWCPPCRESIPHLTELQKKFKKVTFIGVSSEATETVRRFVESAGDDMNYTVAVDKDGETTSAYMDAYGIEGIPYAFVIDQEGRVAWHGHPMEDLEQTLEELSAGKYDVAKARKRAQGRQMLNEFVQLVSTGGDEARIAELGKELEAIDKEAGGLLQGRKFETAEIRKLIQFQGAMRDYQEALFQGKDEAEVEKLAKAAEAVAPKDVKFAELKQELQTRSVFQQYMKAATGEGDATNTVELGGKLAAANVKNAEMLGEMAWTLLTDERIKTRDLPLALKLAKGSYDASNGKDANLLDTYARALFDNGKVGEAIECQKKAIALAKDEASREQLKETLKKYQDKAK